MTWSTRQLAELAGTTVRAVRHYHEVGLLDEPDRKSNGYKRYGVAHLVRLLRVKRMADLGFSLSQIADMGDAQEHPQEALRTLDAELSATIERLQRIRVELSLLLRQSTPADLPPELASVSSAAELSEADRSYLIVLSRVAPPAALHRYAEILRRFPSAAVNEEFDRLPADADEPTRHELAQRLAEQTRAIRREFPAMREMGPDMPVDVHTAGHALRVALKELYNPAQLDVMRRSEVLAEEPPSTSA